MNSTTILLVEDDPSDAELIKRSFVRGEVANEVVLASDGQEALDYIFGTGRHAGRDMSKLPALTLLDFKLPKITGLEVLRRIRTETRTQRMPVVILTSSGEQKDLASGYDLGVNSYIRKPIDCKELARAIQHLAWYWLVLNEPPPTMMEGET